MSTRREQPKNPIEAIQAVSTVCVGSIQQIAELNLSTMREAVEITASATQEISRARTPQEMQYAFYQPMIECVQTYARRYYEILAQAQRDLIDTTTAQLGGRSSFLPGDWGAAMNAFNSNMRRYSAMAEEGVAAAAEGAQQGAAGARSYGKKSA